MPEVNPIKLNQDKEENEEGGDWIVSAFAELVGIVICVCAGVLAIGGTIKLMQMMFG